MDATKKGPRPFVAERVCVVPDKLWLGVREPTGVELMIGHVTGPAGPRSTVGYHEYVTGAQLDFRVLVVRDCISADQRAISGYTRSTTGWARCDLRGSAGSRSSVGTLYRPLTERLVASAPASPGRT